MYIIKYYSVIATQNPVRGHYYPVMTVHIVALWYRTAIFQLGGIGEAFIRYTNKTVAFYSMEEDAFSKKKMNMLIN